MTREHTDDPRDAGGEMVDAGGPHDRGKVMFDTRKAVIVEGWEAAVAHSTSGGRANEDRVALLVNGRINRPPDDASAAERPAERVRHLHMLSWDAAANLVADLHALAARDGTDARFNRMVEKHYKSLKARGLTRPAA